MSNNNSATFTSFSSFSSSSSSSNVNGQPSGQRHMQSSYSDNSGTTVNQASQRLGQPIVQETRRYDAQGNPLLEGAGGGPGIGVGSQRRIEDVTDERQAARDREYEERMEGEYAKREGGA
ncbi:hypothetical protein Tdes44962_MAKER05987 [Teratosphaeria destructans]|uniref:Uncharacterized protein n=1 Tax=Teratosphaeria destructans TaxID=418781 RepID=A0A9W7SIJ6_9PEZI|nr:hypothetical protein Tdes44962_MAKER05987 [Teratosphaeria destructans]